MKKRGGQGNLSYTNDGVLNSEGSYREAFQAVISEYCPLAEIGKCSKKSDWDNVTYLKRYYPDGGIARVGETAFVAQENKWQSDNGGNASERVAAQIQIFSRMPKGFIHIVTAVGCGFYNSTPSGIILDLCSSYDIKINTMNKSGISFFRYLDNSPENIADFKEKIYGPITDKYKTLLKTYNKKALI